MYDEETGNYYYSARYYDPKLSIFISVDPLAEKTGDPYGYCYNNPINLVDPTGKESEGTESTRVRREKDGTYTVMGGNADDGDNGIYIDNKGKNGEKIGYSATPYSFYNTYVNKWMGVINPKDKSGKNFLNDLLKENPNVLDYANNATRGEQYDFKRTNGTDSQIYNDNDVPKFFRGMPILDKIDGLQIYASARDVGNIGAGLVAGLNSTPWLFSRIAFDGLESYQKGYLTQETQGTVYAQKLGWNIGAAIRNKMQSATIPGNGNTGGYTVPKGYIGLGYKQRR